MDKNLLFWLVACSLLFTLPDSRGADMPKPHPSAVTGGAARPQPVVASGSSNNALAIAAGAAVVLTVVWRF